MLTPKITEIPRQPDGEAYYVHCTGGFRAAKIDEKIWSIEPLLYNNKPCIKGFYTKNEVENFVTQKGFAAIGLESIRWRNGNYNSRWMPIICDRTNHSSGPADLWSRISANFRKPRLDRRIPNEKNVKKIISIFDDKNEEEAISQSISLSLRSMDCHIQNIADFYNEELVNFLASGKYNKNVWLSSSRDQNLYADVHSFFLHFGAARDYLASLIAIRIGMSSTKVDSLTKLLDRLKQEHLSEDALLEIMFSKGLISEPVDGEKRWQQSGWLKEASDLRNTFVHHQPYGQMMIEQMGRTRIVDAEIGLYKYYRPIVKSGDSEADILDITAGHYKEIVLLFQVLAESSGYNADIATITSEDIISIDIET